MGVSEEFLVLLRASDIVPGERLSCHVPDDGPFAIKPEVIAEIIESSPFSRLDPLIVRAHLQSEGALAPTLFYRDKAAIELPNEGIAVVKPRFKAGKCPEAYESPNVGLRRLIRRSTRQRSGTDSTSPVATRPTLIVSPGLPKDYQPEFFVSETVTWRAGRLRSG